MKKAISILLTLALVCAMLPAGVVSVAAADYTDTYAVKGGNIYFNAATGEIVDCDDSVTVANIPSEINGVAVTSIGQWAFDWCDNLESVTIPDSVTEMGYMVFLDCSSLTAINVALENPNYSSDHGVLLDKKQTEVIYCPIGFVGAYEIPGSVTRIDDDAFFCCSSLESVTIPEGVTYIGTFAFLGCSSLINVIIPDGVSSIGADTFAGCSSLTSVTIPNSVTSIGEDAFGDCNSLINVIIPDGVTSVDYGAFSYCSSLTNVTIPKSVTSIGGGAFDGCSSLTDVYYAGSVAQWQQIEIEDNNASLTGATIHYNSTGPGPLSGGEFVVFLRGWDAQNREVQFGDPTILSPGVCVVAEDVDVSGIDRMLNTYVYIETEPDENMLDATVTTLRPVTSKIGVPTEISETGLTIDGQTYSCTKLNGTIWRQYQGQEVLYHILDGEIKGLSPLKRSHGLLESWDPDTKRVTIDGVSYPTNLMTDFSFLEKFDQYYWYNVFYLTCGNDDYCPLLRFEGYWYPSDPAQFNADIYHANWLATTSTSTGTLHTIQTPSEVIYDRIQASGMDIGVDLWNALSAVFDTMDDVSNLYDLAVEPKEVYTALILNCLQASASADVINEEVEDNLKLCKELASMLRNSIKAGYQIDMEDDAQFQKELAKIPEEELTDYLEEDAKEWVKKNFPQTAGAEKSFRFIATGLKVVGNLEDFAEYCANCFTLMNVSEAMEVVLQRAYDKCLESYGVLDGRTLAFKECLAMITKSTDELFDQIEKRAVYTVGKIGAEYIVGDLLWEKVTSYIKISCPQVIVFQMVYKAGKTVANQLLNTDDIIEQRVKIEYITNLESIMNGLYQDLQREFLANETQARAATYLSAMRLSFQMRNEDCEVAKKYVDAVDSAFFSQLAKFFGGKDNSDLKRSIEAIRKGYRNSLSTAETFWVYSLQQDYPGTGLYEQYAYLAEEALQKQFVAACPVNVYVYNAQNELVASIVDGRISCSVDDMVLSVNEDQKIVRFYGDADYRVEYVGYDTGTMDTTITEYDAEQMPIRTVNYYDVALEDGRTYSVQTDTEPTQPYRLEDTSTQQIVEADFDSAQPTQAHALTVFSGVAEQGADIFTQTTAQKGESLPLTACVPEGCVFVCWETDGGTDLLADANAASTTLIMPDHDLTVTAKFREIESSQPTAYAVKIVPTSNGTVTANPARAEVGELVTLTVTPNAGYQLKNLDVEGEDDWPGILMQSGNHYSFAMPACDVTVTATFEEIPVSPPAATYAVKIAPTSNGTVTASPERAEAGTRVWLTLEANQGYYRAGLSVRGDDGVEYEVRGEDEDPIHSAYAFIMPACDVTVTADFRKDAPDNPSYPSSVFIDVPVSAWYGAAVDYVVEHQIMNGMDATHFKPAGNMTRAMFVTVLWRIAGEPTPRQGGIFVDVPVGAYYAKAVYWALESGITTGADMTHFNPNKSVTREQAAAFMHRYVGGQSTNTDVLRRFPDAGKVQPYARSDLAWAINVGLFTGVETNTGTILNPQGTATRAQVAVILMRLCEEV